MSLLFLLMGSSTPTGIIATINGTEREVLLSSFSLERTANGRDVLQCEVLSEDGSVRPGLDEEVRFVQDGEVLFAGLIISARERGADGMPIEAITTEITANDYKALAARRYVNETIPAGSTLKEALEIIVPYIPGATLDPAQVDGPTLEELPYAYVRTEEVLNELTLASDGYIWDVDDNKVLSMIEPGTIAAPFNLIEANQDAIGDVWVDPKRDSNYANRIIVRNATLAVEEEDAAEILDHGEWEAVYQSADTLTEDAMQALAVSILARSTPILKELEYTVDTMSLVPGMTQLINLPSRHVNNTFLITEVNIRPAPDSFDMWSTVLAIEGLVYQTGWRETYRRWNGGGTRSVNGVEVGGGGVAPQRYAYPLGGSGQEAVESSVPDWVPVAGGPAIGGGSYKVQINTVPRGTTAATVTVQLKVLDVGNTVQARLYDVTDDAPVTGPGGGLSGVVTATDWELVTFGVTLTPGSHIYELQLLSGLADSPVMGSGGYVE